MRRWPAPAKLNLALVAGPRREDGRHVVTTILQRIDLADRISIEPARTLSVTGFPADTLVQQALGHLSAAAPGHPAWSVEIDKRVPVAAGLGGGSSDAATALRVANEGLERPLSRARLFALAAAIGADVPFFLETGPQLAIGDGTELSPLELPQDYWVLVVLPHGAQKTSTAAVYDAFDARGGERGHVERRDTLLRTLAGVARPRDLAALPANDLASSPLAGELSALGAFRADVSGAGPAVYGLFTRADAAKEAERHLRRYGRTWVTVPAWYF